MGDDSGNSSNQLTAPKKLSSIGSNTVHPLPSSVPTEDGDIQPSNGTRKKVQFAQLVNRHGNTDLFPISENDLNTQSNKAASRNRQGSMSEPSLDNDDVEGQASGESEGVSPQKQKKWDVFIQKPLDNELDTEGCWNVTHYICKILTYIFLFAMVFGGATISIGTVVFAAGNMRLSNYTVASTQDQTPIHFKASFLECVNYTILAAAEAETATNSVLLDFKESESLPFNSTVDSSERFAECLVLPRGWQTDDKRVDACLAPDDEVESSDAYYTEMCDTVAIQWVWCLFLIIVTPYGFVFLKCLWTVMFRKTKRPNFWAVTLVLLVDTLYVTGVCMLAFVVLPLLDNVIQMAMVMMGVGLTPAIMTTVQRLLHRDFYSQENEKNDEVQDRKRFILRLSLDILALVCQIIGLITWPIFVALNEEDNKHLSWSVPVSLSLISLGYWENYVDLAPYKETEKEKPRSIPQMRKSIRKDFGVRLRMITSFWKMIVALLMTMAFVSIHGVSMQTLFSLDTSKCGSTISHDVISSLELDWIWIWLTNTGAALVCYYGARTAAKILVQSFSYALPLCLATPCAMVFLGLGCDSWNDDPCYYADGLPSYAFFRCQAREGYDWVEDLQIWLIITWAFSQIWLTWHIWWQENEKLASSDRLFEQPLYDGLLLQQSLLYNRNRNEQIHEYKSIEPEIFTESNLASNIEPSTTLSATTMEEKDSFPMIYICATMWHETATEMMMMMRSVFKLDRDQAVRKQAQKDLGKIDPNYYEFEAHIFFDDAMENLNEREYCANKYVKLLVRSMDRAARDVHKVYDMKVPPPIKYPTPYGGRLEWTMPGGNKVFAHLKDKQKARHKKRWSQVMYMYYFLGFKLMANDLSDERKERKANNTMLLALDGDVDFEPKALALLVDLMKRNPKVGAACGRIHPLGTGPMIWYQLFEYALGHWLQKAAEDVFGCVLCSPGCFSLFRGSALMEKNVMNRYTTKAEEPSHFVQYDQGEDRWLCTLLLQAGFKVEYCAASDARTFAPEGFYEFYRQRRRWGPSSMANILDLLLSWKHTTKVNDYISVIYILYQTMIFVFSLFGTGTIFLMVVGALEIALGWDIRICIILNLIPVVLFVIICFVAKDDTQLLTALILTALYAMLQMVVLIGLIIQMIDEGWCSPTTLFFLYVAGTFLLAALLHPREFLCVCHGFTYFLAIPSMYMLLLIYSICNLHVVSWGTRETTKSDEQIAIEEALVQADLKGTPKDETPKTATGGRRFSCCDLCSCHLCPPDMPLDDSTVIVMADLMQDDQQQMDEIRKQLTDCNERLFQMQENGRRGFAEGDSSGSATPSSSPSRRRPSNQHPAKDRARKSARADRVPEIIVDDQEEGPQTTNSDDKGTNPVFWAEDKELGSGLIGKLPSSETKYFDDFIQKYLAPLEQNKEKEEKMANQLKDLRNKMSAAFLLGNAMLVITLLVLQLNELFLPWFCEDMYIEPISFVFLIFYAFVMFVQTIGMLIHRAGTFLHIMASVILPCYRRGSRDQSEFVSPAELRETAGLCRLDREGDMMSERASIVENTTDLEDVNAHKPRGSERRGTVHNIMDTKQRSQEAYPTMSKAHEERVEFEDQKYKYKEKSDEELKREITELSDNQEKRNQSKLRRMSRVYAHRISLKHIEEEQAEEEEVRSNMEDDNGSSSDCTEITTR